MRDSRYLERSLQNPSKSCVFAEIEVNLQKNIYPSIHNCELWSSPFNFEVFNLDIYGSKCLQNSSFLQHNKSECESSILLCLISEVGGLIGAHFVHLQKMGWKM